MSYQKNFKLQRENIILKQNLDILKKHVSSLKIQLNDSILKEQKAIKNFEQNNEQYLCNICYKDNKNIILLPCFHFNLCHKCLNKIDKCTICREPIECYHYVYS